MNETVSLFSLPKRRWRNPKNFKDTKDTIDVMYLILTACAFGKDMISLSEIQFKAKTLLNLRGYTLNYPFHVLDSPLKDLIHRVFLFHLYQSLL